LVVFTKFGQIFQSMDETSKLLLICSFVLLIFSLILFNKSTKKGLLFLFSSSLCIGAAFATFNPYLNLWDEQFHALVAKNLIDNPLKPTLYQETPLEFNYKSWIANHIWLHKPPLSLWQIAVSIKVFGVNYFAVRVPSIIMHALLVFPIHSIGKTIWNEKTGYYAALVFSFLNFPLELVAGYQTSDHVDMAFMFYITMSIWAWIKFYETRRPRWIVVLGLFVGLAILTKWLVGLLVFAGIGSALIGDSELRKSWQFWKYLLLSVSLICILVLPWHVFAYLNFPQEYLHEFQYNTQHFYTIVEGHGGGYWYYWKNLFTLYGSADLLPYLILFSLVFVWKFVRHKNYALFLLVMIICPYAFFTLAETKMPAFTAIVIPLIILVTCAFVGGILDFYQSKSYRWQAFSKWLLLPVLLLLALNLINPKRIYGVHFKDHGNEVLGRNDYKSRTTMISTTSFPIDQKCILFIDDPKAMYHENILWMFYHDDVYAYERSSFTVDLKAKSLAPYCIFELKNGVLVMLSKPILSSENY